MQSHRTSRKPFSKEESKEQINKIREIILRKWCSSEWVLVPDGSFLGYFDWVPRKFRVGPWSSVALVYLTLLFYSTAVFGAFFWSSRYNPSSPLFEQTTQLKPESLKYPELYSLGWYYHVIVSMWMSYVIYLVITGPVGFKAWGTYTIQSWSLLLTRHLACAVAPLTIHAVLLAEYIRFPVACSASVTFIVWNFALMPFIYFGGMKDSQARKRFLDFCFSFRLVQIHVFNILYCYLNIYFSPSREMDAFDFYLAVVSVLIYAMWYLFILDRLGIHFYPIFSPRDGRVVATTWTFAVALYVTLFYAWQRLMI